MIKNNFWRFFSYILLIIFTFSVQSAYGVLPKIYGHHIDILIPIIVSITVLDSLELATFSAGFLAIIYDFNYQIPQGLSFVFFVLAIIITHFLVRQYYTRNVITQMMFSTVIILSYRLLIYGFIASGFMYYAQIVIVEILISVILSPIAYLCIRGLKGRSLE